MIHVFGVRHHGPGCARALRAALEELQPDAVLVEGPPDAAEILPLAAHEAMRPPVAILVHPVDAPGKGVFYPFAAFSPEWVAIRHGLARAVPVRFMDLPQAARFARKKATASGRGTESEKSDEHEHEHENEDENEKENEAIRDDPIGLLAEAAGYTDRELWWEHQVEARRDAKDLFAAVLEGMTAVREAVGEKRERDLRREAYMRQTIRAAEKEGFQRIAVVCGAWHAPVLATLGPAKPDAERLKGLGKVKVAATWVPWTNGRLTFRSGYGAGVDAPGYYEHLFAAPDRAALRWVTEAARLLRSEDLDAPSASAIETVRLAEALAALRGVPLPGLRELDDAVLAVLCNGAAAPLSLIRRRLAVGEKLGEVPPDAPQVPLARDVAAEQKRLRLKPAAEEKTVDLDLRNENDRARSRLIRRLSLLGIEWGTPQEASRRAGGTFHEIWVLEWDPQFAVALVEASPFGSTLEEASAAKVRTEADRADALEPLSELLDAAILADLPAAADHALGRIRERAALASDVRHLMDALPPLARVARYGDVRGTHAGLVVPVIDGLLERILVGLPSACVALDDEAAGRMVESIGRTSQAIALLERAAERERLREALRKIAGDSVHGLVRGFAVRLLLDQGALAEGELERLASFSLSTAVPAPEAAAWLEGLLKGSGLLLLHQDGVWAALDGWLDGLKPESFVEMLPLVRRAFSDFTPPERRAMGEKVARLREAPRARPAGRAIPEEALAGIDRARADLVLPVLAQILGGKVDAATV